MTKGRSGRLDGRVAIREGGKEEAMGMRDRARWDAVNQEWGGGDV